MTYTIYVCPECGFWTSEKWPRHQFFSNEPFDKGTMHALEPIEVVPRSVADELAAELARNFRRSSPRSESSEHLAEGVLAKYREATK